MVETFIDILEIFQFWDSLEAIFLSNCTFSNHVCFIFSWLQNIIFESNDWLLWCAHAVGRLNHHLIMNFWWRFFWILLCWWTSLTRIHQTDPTIFHFYSWQDSLIKSQISNQQSTKCDFSELNSFHSLTLYSNGNECPQSSKSVHISNLFDLFFLSDKVRICIYKNKD